MLQRDVTKKLSNTNKRYSDGAAIYFANKVIRSILHILFILRQFFGFQPIVECTYFVDFKNMHGFADQHDIKFNLDDWNRYPDLDKYNLEVADLSKIMTKGMTIDFLSVSFYLSKLLQITG